MGLLLYQLQLTSNDCESTTYVLVSRSVEDVHGVTEQRMTIFAISNPSSTKRRASALARDYQSAQDLLSKLISHLHEPFLGVAQRDYATYMPRSNSEIESIVKFFSTEAKIT